MQVPSLYIESLKPKKDSFIKKIYEAQKFNIANFVFWIFLLV